MDKPQAQVLAAILPKALQLNLSEAVLEMAISGLCSDSRAVRSGFAFIALKSPIFNGGHYIQHAIESGAAIILTDDFLVHERFTHPNIACLYFENLQQQLGLIAAKFYGDGANGRQMIGVTGTNGKSTVVSLVAQLYQALGKKTAIIGTLGYGFIGERITHSGMTTPDAISCQRLLAELADEHADTIAMEVSSHGIELNRVAGIQYQIGIITNITRDHLDFHGSFENYVRVKKSFLLDSSVTTAIVNYDDELCKALWSELHANNKTCYSYSVSNSAAGMYCSQISYSKYGLTAHIHSPLGEGELRSSLIGEFNLSNLLAAISCCVADGVPLAEVLELIPNLKPVSGRLQRVQAPKAQSAADIFVDYAHTPDALTRVLTATRQHGYQRIWLVFGCGGDRDKGKRALMGEIAVANADKVIITSDNPRSEDPKVIIEEIQQSLSCLEKVSSIVDRKQAITWAVQHAHIGDAVIIAGKGHENYQLIGEGKISFNDVEIAQACIETMDQVSTNSLKSVGL
ncbi:MAG: UDP-N-acetylmuramoyl-L-alanyl-D-glutamate--2,6-diaminopimelate ligase [Alteromonadaceae bacterium]|nr:MAG: UDP-N-acetylmuramoyl-L-alanyl-D-glutamate--2,6-diaminopimelate ligase [Alteromonadaceae bacterium]